MSSWQSEYAKRLIDQKNKIDSLYSHAILHYKINNEWKEILTYINPAPLMTFRTENDCIDTNKYYYTYLDFMRSNLTYFWEYLNDQR